MAANITHELNDQSMRLAQAAAALRAVSGLAGALGAARQAGFLGGQQALDADDLAGLAATLAQGIEAPQRELDATISRLERAAR